MPGRLAAPMPPGVPVSSPGLPEESGRSPTHIPVSKRDLLVLALDHLIHDGHADAASALVREALLDAGTEDVCAASAASERARILESLYAVGVTHAVDALNDAFPGLLEENPQLLQEMHMLQAMQALEDGLTDGAGPCTPAISHIQSYLSHAWAHTRADDGKQDADAMLPTVEAIAFDAVFAGTGVPRLAHESAEGMRDRVSARVNAAMLARTPAGKAAGARHASRLAEIILRGAQMQGITPEAWLQQLYDRFDDGKADTILGGGEQSDAAPGALSSTTE